MITLMILMGNCSDNNNYVSNPNILFNSKLITESSKYIEPYNLKKELDILTTKCLDSNDSDICKLINEFMINKKVCKIDELFEKVVDFKYLLETINNSIEDYIPVYLMTTHYNMTINKFRHIAESNDIADLDMISKLFTIFKFIRELYEPPNDFNDDGDDCVDTPKTQNISKFKDKLYTVLLRNVKIENMSLIVEFINVETCFQAIFKTTSLKIGREKSNQIRRFFLMKTHAERYKNDKQTNKIRFIH